MKYIRIAVTALFAATVGLAGTHPFGNPGTEPEKGLGTLLQHADLPADPRRVLISKCADCHSNETRWPVYARLAPGSWLIERDITQARAKMNFSQWDDLSPDARDVLIAKILQESRAGEMPPVQYRVLHWGSQLTSADLAAIRSLSKTTLDETKTEAPGDAERGRLVFQKRCTGCHALNADREGPRLGGVFGRKAGVVQGFNYSAGLRNSGLTWDEATLERWLTDPDVMVPDTRMDFHLPKAQERHDLIAYFRQ